MKNSGKMVLITGASRGIGAAVAKRLAAKGYHLILHCRSQIDELQELSSVLARRYEVNCCTTQFDIADREASHRQLQKLVEVEGAPYGVVLNAGIAIDNAFPALEGEQWDRVVDTNLNGFYNVLSPLVMPMVRTRSPGRIVVMTSVSGITGNRGQTNYSASKAGLIGASKSLALELAKRRITVNCVAPGLIETDMTKELPIAEVEKMIPARRMGKPSEVAAAVGWLLSDDAAYITRQVLSVNGGLC